MSRGSRINLRETILAEQADNRRAGDAVEFLRAELDRNPNCRGEGHGVAVLANQSNVLRLVGEDGLRELAGLKYDGEGPSRV